MVGPGYNPGNHPATTTVVQQQSPSYTGAPDEATLMAFTYQYDQIGKLTGIVDWRGRPDNSPSHLSGLQTSASPSLTDEHPSDVSHTAAGYHQPGFPSAFDPDMTAPGGMPYPDLLTGWSRGAVPSDAMFGYDTLYQLRSEDREYVSALGEDGEIDGSGAWVGGKRIEALDWAFDSRGSMTEWKEDETTPNSDSKGRALGGNILNGFQLNEAALNGCNNYLDDNTSLPAAGSCYIPDAIYFASNIVEAGAGRGTCVWVEYDTSGRMRKQTVRTGCTTCEYLPGDSDKGVAAATCSDYAGSGTPGEIDYDPPINSKTTRYDYLWNTFSQLTDATRYEDGLTKAHMSYVYGASGGRVIRQKDLTAVSTDNIKQDIYLGGYERRAVEMQNDLGNAVSIFSAEAIAYANVEGTRLVKYSSGARIQWKIPEGSSNFETDPQIFLTFSNHLGSTSAVTDYEDGTLVEWKTNYAYGGDESGWKNGDPKYDNADEPYGFTGKEEDVEVGLHYFGARYYSSYLGRWLSPDPPVVHGGGLGNHYNYGANTPYIAVDPDGNWVQFLVAAIVGSVVGSVNEIIERGGIHSFEDVGHVLLAGVRGAGVACAGTANPALGAAAATADAQLEMLIEGGSVTDVDFHKQSAITFGTSIGSSYAGQGMGQASKSIGSAVGKEIFNAGAS